MKPVAVTPAVSKKGTSPLQPDDFVDPAPVEPAEEFHDAYTDLGDGGDDDDFHSGCCGVLPDPDEDEPRYGPSPDDDWVDDLDQDPPSVDSIVDAVDEALVESAPSSPEMLMHEAEHVFDDLMSIATQLDIPIEDLLKTLIEKNKRE